MTPEQEAAWIAEMQGRKADGYKGAAPTRAILRGAPVKRQTKREILVQQELIHLRAIRKERYPEW